MEKSCQRCNSIFECRHDNVMECHCIDVSLTEADFMFIGESYNDCLCKKCLLELKDLRLKKFASSEKINSNY